ncbi:MAG: DUF4421 family protein [Bacteroidales bacterium]|nr:DUF4421 family protein [Bacteroidales bacterium]MBQ5541168.1 DUF4421 family protein [Bacteroidales bacterium]MEE3447896.1 DUF4421 family protein [Bacteroidales bacterium]
MQSENPAMMGTYKLISIVILTFFIAVKVAAQDTNYVKKYNNLVNLKTFIYNNGLDFWDKGSGLNYIPGIHTGIGIGAYCKYLPFDFSIRQEVSPLGNSEHYHKRRTTDMLLKGYTKYFAGDISIQKYNGFYTQEAESYKDVWTRYNQQDEEREYEPDLRVFQLEAVGQYIFNHERFSYKAGFTAYEEQKIPAGSFLAGASFHLLKIDSDSSLVRINNSSHLKASNFGINYGYAYNYTFGKRSCFFVSAIMSINVSNPLSKTVSYKDFTVSPSARLKSAYWLNFEHWSLGLTGIYNIIHQTFSKDCTIYLHSRKVELVLIRRLCYKTDKK